MIQKFKFIAAFVLVSVALLITCKTGSDKQIARETPTQGHIKIGVDEAYQLLADAEMDTFEGLYKEATIDPVYAPEDSILQLFMADSVKTMITSRKLSENEEAYLKDKLIIVRTTHIAWDALAYIVNNSNKDTLIRYNTLKDIFSGKISNWKDVNNSSRLGNLKVVFDNQGSSNVRMVMRKFGIQGPLPEYCYSANSNANVIEYVESHPEAIGIISVNWISDRDDSISHSFLRRIRVVGVTPEFDSESDDFLKPHPAYIADKTYPFVREVYAITRETFAGLGRGFVQFVSYDQGQRIILKMGMLPATMPIRLVQIQKQ